MKKLILLIQILLLELICFGQNTILNINPENDTIIVNFPVSNGILDISKTYISGEIDSLLLGLQLLYRHTYISIDSAEYEATNDTVMYVDKNLVVIDTSENSVIDIGMLVKFGNSIFTIIDTLGSIDSLMLSSNYYESIGDTMYLGVLPTWYDESGNNNNASSLTSRNPIIIWSDSDTASLRFNNGDVGRRLDFTNINLGKEHSALAIVNFSDIILNQVITDGSSSDYIVYQYDNNEYRYRVNSGGIRIMYTDEDVVSGKRYNSVVTRDTTYLKLYIDNSLNYNTILVNNDDLIQNNIGGGSSSEYFDGKVYEIRLYDRELTPKNISDLYDLSQDRFVRDTGFVASYNMVQKSGTYGNTGLDYDIRHDYILCAEYNTNKSAKIYKKTRFGTNLDTIDFTSYIDYIQGVSYDQDTMYYAWGTMKDSTYEAKNAVIIGISENRNKVFEEQTPLYVGIQQTGLQCQGDTAIWIKGNDVNYIRLFSLSPFIQIDSFYTPLDDGTEGFWMDSDSTYWTGYPTEAIQYRIQTGTVRKLIPNPTSQWEGCIVDKRGWLWFNSDEYLKTHDEEDDNAAWVFDPEFYPVE
jgi:hypothetical protein